MNQFFTNRGMGLRFFAALMLLLTNFNANSQCAADTCNSVYTVRILQASYHSQIAKTNTGFLITGQELAANGVGAQTLYTAIPSATYPMPVSTYPILGAVGGRTQAVFLGDNGIFYAVGNENSLLDASVTAGTAWGATTLALPTGVVVCDVQRMEGASGDQVTGGYMAILSGAGNLYVTGTDASFVESTATNAAIFTQVTMPVGVTVTDFAVGYRTLMIWGSDGNLYVSGTRTYMGNATALAAVTTPTIFTTQPPLSAGGIMQIQSGYGNYFVLDTDSTIHVLGFNQYGELGVGNTAQQLSWSKVGSGSGTGILGSVRYISTNSTNERWQNSSAILTNRTLRSWGSNAFNAITGPGTIDEVYPVVPCNNPSGVLQVANGAHVTPAIDVGLNIWNIGHNVFGACGDGSTGDRTC